MTDWPLKLDTALWSSGQPGRRGTRAEESCERASVGYVCLKHERQAERAINDRLDSRRQHSKLR